VDAVVRLIARPSICWQSVSDLTGSIKNEWSRSPGATEAEELVELSGRICYMSFGQRQSPRSNREYLRNLIDKGHESVLEHAVWTLEFSGITRAFTHQLVRHRIGFSYSQLSQQYVDHEDFELIPPIDFEKYPDAARAWDKARGAVHAAYVELHRALENESVKGSFGSETERRRFVNSVARQVLPNAVSTRIMVTANARALRHFLSLRGGIEGDSEMRQVSSALLRVMNIEAPGLFEDFEEVLWADGLPAVIARKR
jgi:thymidylate synthase (FAD)